jgi:flagellar motility protein MotE (MotC chaperone)
VVKKLEEIERPYSKIEWFLYIIILPLFFTIGLTFILLTFLGYNVVDTALGLGNKVPGLASILPEPKGGKEGNQLQDSEKIQSQLQQSEKDIKKYESQIQELENGVKQKEIEVEQLSATIKELEKELEEKKVTDHERLEKRKQLAKLYGEMSAGKAAPIIEKLSPSEAAGILEEMKDNQKTAILAKLDPEVAANLTVTMKEMGQAENPEIAALQERVKILTKQVLDLTTGSKTKVSMLEMATTFSQMSTKQAATILSDMSLAKAEFKLGTTILANMKDENRSTILSEMSTEVAKKYTKALLN